MGWHSPAIMSCLSIPPCHLGPISTACSDILLKYESYDGGCPLSAHRFMVAVTVTLWCGNLSVRSNHINTTGYPDGLINQLIGILGLLDKNLCPQTILNIPIYNESLAVIWANLNINYTVKNLLYLLFISLDIILYSSQKVHFKCYSKTK